MYIEHFHVHVRHQVFCKFIPFIPHNYPGLCCYFSASHRSEKRRPRKAKLFAQFKSECYSETHCFLSSLLELGSSTHHLAPFLWLHISPLEHLSWSQSLQGSSNDADDGNLTSENAHQEQKLYNPNIT